MIGDIVGKVLTVYKADTSDMKAKLSELSNEEKKLAQEQLKAAEARNKSIDDHIKGIGKWVIALGSVTGAVVAGKAAFAEYEKSQKLSIAAGRVNIEALSKAAGGLKTNMELLDFAAKAQAGSFKLSSAQMETALQAMRAMTRAGFDQEEVTKKVTDAIVKLEGDGLKDFGVRVRESKGDADKFNAVMEALAGQADKVRGSAETSTESIQKLGVSFSDSMSQIKRSLGEVVVSMAPLLEKVAYLAEKAASIVAMSGRGGSMLLDLTHMSRDEYLRKHAGVSAREFDTGYDPSTNTALREYVLAGGSEADFLAQQERNRQRDRDRGTAFGNYLGGEFNKLMGKYFPAKTAPSKTSGKIDEAWLLRKAQEDARFILGTSIDVEASNIQSSLGSGSLGTQADVETRDVFGRAEVFDLEAPLRERLTSDWNARLEASRGRESKLEQMFGPLTEFNAYKMAFDTLSGAVGSALTAWIDGSSSAGEAFKKFIGEALKATAVQMAMEALKHGAMAIGSLAMYDYPGAALHGKAAAAFGAGAIVVGAAAKALGGGGASAPGIGSAGGYRPSAPDLGGGGRGMPTSEPKIVVFGQDFVTSSPRQRAQHIKRMLNDVGINSGGEDR